MCSYWMTSDQIIDIVVSCKMTLSGSSSHLPWPPESWEATDKQWFEESDNSIEAEHCPHDFRRDSVMSSAPEAKPYTLMMWRKHVPL